MADTTAPATQPATTTPAADEPKITRSVENMAILKYITDSETLIKTAGADAEIAPILARHGFDAAGLAEGTALVAAARAAITDRATGRGEKLKSAEDLHAAIADARDDYAAFREIARGVFPGQPERSGLSLTGDVPDDLQRFISLAHASYAAAGGAAYAEKLTRRGYGSGRLSALIAALNSLTTDDSEQNSEEGDALGDTTARDAAYKALKAWIKELKATCRGSLRKRPDLRAKLGL